MNPLEKACVHVYTGDGKGKSTAAFGLALRAAGAGMKVFIAQFTKGRTCSEHKAFEKLRDMITLKQFGRNEFICHKPSEEDLRDARRGLDESRTALASGQYGLVILDEANIAVHFGLITVEELLDLIASRPKNVELVITGRNADDRIIEKADLVTEMVNIKHYHEKGLPARKGIEY